MKTQRITIFSLILVLMLGIWACQDDVQPVPQASTQANFSWAIDTLREGEAIIGFGVQFTNTSILAQSYHWDFGNGETSDQENPYMVYTESGQYTIRLTVTSGNDLHYNRLERAVTLTLATGALPIPFAEDFDSSEEIPDILTIWDLDGDGLTWYWGALADGGGHLRSQSWDPDEGPLTPDNWVITPQLELGMVDEGEQIVINIRVGVFANTPQYRKEHYGVFVSEGGMNPEDFVLVFEETFAEDTPRLTPLPRQINITEYQGKSVFVAIRHYDVTDLDRMFLDFLEVTKQ